MAGVDEGRLRAWKSPDDVVRSALKAMTSRRAITVPGAVNVSLMAAVKLMPRFVARRIAGSMFKHGE